MAYNLSPLKQKIEETSEWLSKELQGVRTGRATPLILDSVVIEAYGSRMAIRDVASVGIEDARTLRIAPWDLSQSKAIEKAITVANLGVSVSVDEKGLRVHFPELSGDRRAALQKLVREKLEEARITLRGARDEARKEIDREEKDGKMSEDDKFRAQDDVQKAIDDGNAKLEEIADKKEKEVAE